MRGFEIVYRDGRTQVFNSIDGENKGCINLGENDVLVGMVMRVTDESSRNPRQYGFIVMR